MEEIDIIELLKRVKEGKAPKRIEIDNEIYTYNEGPNKILLKYQRGIYNLGDARLCLDTKIKILDKPIIEELEPVIEELEEIDNHGTYIKVLVRSNRDKINEIIRYINKEEK